MKRSVLKTVCLILAAALLLCACGGAGGKTGKKKKGEKKGQRETKTEFVMPEASGETVYGTDTIKIDASHADLGYIMINYTGGAEKVQIQIKNPDGTMYPYPLTIGDFSTFPLTMGDGTYQVDVLENVSADMYSVGFSQAIDVTLSDEFAPFLYPNQYVNYTSESEAVSLGMDLSKESSDDIDYITNVYNYVIENISYDTDKAQNVSVNYIPNVDDTLSSKKGICFDYASVMSSMLRSQGVPTKLVVGYSGTAYHAWISVWLEETGWVDDVIEFDGTDWSLVDPTLAASNDSEAVKEYVGDGANYTAKYTY